MEHKIEGSDLRACIDKAYDAGYNEAMRKALKYAKNHKENGGYISIFFYSDFKEKMKL